MSDADVRDWLGRLASAWQRRDLPALRLLGVVGGGVDAGGDRDHLPPRDGYQVSFANEVIRTDGRYASVAFDRAMRDGRGRIVSTGRDAYALEKQPSGLVALRAR
jgi:hypothetical protein